MALQDLATVEMVRNVIDGTTPVAQATNAINAENAVNATNAQAAATAVTADKVAHKLTITAGDSTVEFDGSKDKSLNISLKQPLYLHIISAHGSFVGNLTSGLGIPSVTAYVFSSSETQFTSFEEIYNAMDGNTPIATGYFHRGAVGNYGRSPMVNIGLHPTRFVAFAAETGSTFYPVDNFDSDTVVKIL